MSIRLGHFSVAALMVLATHTLGNQASASVALQDLLNGGSISAGSVTFSNWQLIDNLGTITPDFSQVRVNPLTSEPSRLGIQVLGNRQFDVLGDLQSIIFTLGYRVQGLAPIVASQQGITDFAFAGAGGLIDIQQQVKEAGGGVLSMTTTTLDPAFGVANPFSSAANAARAELQVMTSISLFGNAATSGVSLNSFQQTFSQVPEPSSFTLLLACASLIAIWRRDSWRRLLAGATASVMFLAGGLHAADHLDAPLVAADGRLDINDVYAFQSGSTNTVLAMTVNPLAGVLSPTTFNPAGRYEFKVDNNGDALAEITFDLTFSHPDGQGKQRVVLRRNGALIARGLTGENIPIRATGGGMLRCGTFDDPFFFDLAGFRASPINFTGTDFFKGLNVSAIVLEIPSSTLGRSNIGVWARTVVNGAQFDRMGRPAINTVLISSASKDAFNAGFPVNDPAVFGAAVVARITALSGGDAAFAATITGVLLPDILTVDTSSSAGFLNGRRLPDDVIDAELSLLTKGAISGDGVNANDKAFLGVFPYLAPPHN